jgi:AcrR family transcriptional regulator
MPSTPSPGLRDRKRIQTRARIEDAAVFLVLRDGLEATTVDAISERADISPRTFFNYFDSKDSAILGVPQAGPDEEVASVELDGDLVQAVVRLLMRAMGVALESRASMHEDRLEVIRRHPQVLAGQMTQLSARAGRLTAAIEELMAATPVFADAEDLAPRAELVLALCGGAVRAAARQWAAEGPSGSVQDIEQRATALIKEVVGKLA